MFTHSLKGQIYARERLLDKFLVLLIDSPEIIPVAVDIQSHMGNRNSSIIRVLRVVLVDNPHHPSDELDIGR